jgi:hypothetical protein
MQIYSVLDNKNYLALAMLGGNYGDQYGFDARKVNGEKNIIVVGRPEDSSPNICVNFIENLANCTEADYNVGTI